MLDASHTLKLIEEAQKNNDEAKEKLINENSPLIKSVVKLYLNKGIEYDDLYQLGSLGFLKAINNFDSSFNVKFSTYAVPMIVGEIKRYLRDNGIVKISRKIKTLSVKINRYIDEYNNLNNSSPSIEEVAEYFDIDVNDVIYAMESSKQIVSLNTVIGDDDGKDMTLIDRVENDQSIDKEMDNHVLYKVIEKLPPRDRKIIILRYFRDKTQKEIAQELGVSQVQISRLENKILLKMKDIIKWNNSILKIKIGLFFVFLYIDNNVIKT